MTFGCCACGDWTAGAGNRGTRYTASVDKQAPNNEKIRNTHIKNTDIHDLKISRLTKY